MNSNWTNDPRINCKSPSNWVELIEKDLNFEVLKNLKVFVSGMNFWTYNIKCLQNIFDFDIFFKT